MFLNGNPVRRVKQISEEMVSWLDIKENRGGTDKLPACKNIRDTSASSEPLAY